MPATKDNIFICNTDLKFVRPELHDFLSYWKAKRGTRLYPGRTDIKPGEITPLLPWTHMHDVISGGEEFRIRLIGTILSDTFGDGNMRGEPISVLPPGVFARVKQGIESCFAPLSANGTDIDMIIAVSILEKRR